LGLDWLVFRLSECSDARKKDSTDLEEEANETEKLKINSTLSPNTVRKKINKTPKKLEVRSRMWSWNIVRRRCGSTILTPNFRILPSRKRDAAKQGIKLSSENQGAIDF